MQYFLKEKSRWIRNIHDEQNINLFNKDRIRCTLRLPKLPAVPLEIQGTQVRHRREGKVCSENPELWVPILPLSSPLRSVGYDSTFSVMNRISLSCDEGQYFYQQESIEKFIMAGQQINIFILFYHFVPILMWLVSWGQEQVKRENKGWK